MFLCIVYFFNTILYSLRFEGNMWVACDLELFSLYSPRQFFFPWPTSSEAYFRITGPKTIHADCTLSPSQYLYKGGRGKVSRLMQPSTQVSFIEKTKDLDPIIGKK